MDTVLKSTVFSFIDPPNVRISRPKWTELPSAMGVFSFVLVTYFLVTAGVIYDIINEPPSMGQTMDERGNAKPVAIMPWRMNGQYIMEGLAGAFMFTLGGIGFIILEKSNEGQMARLQRLILLGIGMICVCVAFFATNTFIKIKMPSYSSY